MRRACAVLAALGAVLVLSVPSAGATTHQAPAAPTALDAPAPSAPTTDLAALRDEVVAAADGLGVGLATAAVDASAGQVVVGASGDTAAAAAVLRSRFGPAVRVEQVSPPTLATRAAPGQTMKGGLQISSSEGLLCSSSFGAHLGAQTFVATAGHCGSNGAQWRIGADQTVAYFGTGSRDGFATGSATDSEVLSVPPALVAPADCIFETDSLCRRVVGVAATVAQGQQVCKSGYKTGVTCGAVLATDVTVSYSVNGSQVLIKHAVAACVALDHGDSGSPVYRRVGDGAAVVLGILSGAASSTSQCGGNLVLPAQVMYFTLASAALTAPSLSRLRFGYREAMDFSGDPCPDVIGQASGNLFVYPGACASRFAGLGGFVGDGWAMFDTVRRTPDMSGDGCPDVVGRTPAGDLYLYPGACTGGFAGSGAIIGRGWNAYTTFLAPGDFTGDGCADLLGLAANGDLYLYPGDCRGGFASGQVIGRGWNAFAQVLAPGDLTGDGCADLLGLAANGDLYLYPGDCNGGFAAGGTVIGVGWNMFDTIATPGDFDGDGCADLIGRTPDGRLYLYPGACNGAFAGSVSFLGDGWNIFERLV